jgi:V/A-type H+-transporting ATPase subunit E
MGIEGILLKISEDVKLEAERILADASKEAEDILKETEKEASLRKDKIIAVGRAEEEFAFGKEVVTTRLSAQKEALGKKRSQIDNCFNDALNGLLNLDVELYRRLIKGMLTKINFQEEAEIVFSTEDKSRINQDYVHNINRHLKLSFSDDIRAGFILKTKELIFNNSLDNILNDLRTELEPKVAEILFKE